MISRRSLFHNVGGAAAAASFPFARRAAAATDGGPFRFNVSGISPPDNPNSVLFKQYLDQLSDASNGRLKFAWHPGGVLVPTNEALDALGQGTIDMLFSNPSYYAGKVSIGAYGELPFYTKGYRGLIDLFYESGMQKIVDAAYREKSNTTVLQIRPFNGYVFIMARSKTVHTLADIAGKKIRTGGGLGDDVLKAIGGVPVKLVPGEFYQSMQQGIVDGFLLPLYALESYKLNELHPTVTSPGPGSLSGQLVWMNLDRWNALPPDLQELFRTTTLNERAHMATFLDAEDDKALAYAKKAGVEMFELSAADRAEVTERTRSVISTFETREGERGKRLVELLRSHT